MNFLKELLLEGPISGLLLEDFGNLKSISKNLIDGLKDVVTFQSFSSNERKVEKTTSNIIGKNSKIEDVELTNGSKIGSLFSDNKNVQAVVIYDQISGDQYGIIAKISVPGNKKWQTSNYLNVVFDFGAIAGKDFDENQLEKIKNIADKQGLSPTQNKDVKRYQYKISYDDNATKTKIEKFARELIKLVKPQDKKDTTKNLMMKIIYADAERIITKSERAKNKAGSIELTGKMTPSEIKDFNLKAKNQLETRLNNFKRDKLKASGKDLTIDKIVETIRKEGYLDKILVNGYIYNYYQERINISALRKGDHKKSRYDSDLSYIKYKIDEDAESYIKIRREFWNAINDVEELKSVDPVAYEKEEEKIKRKLKMPPRYFTVMLDFEGGMIVPYDIQVNNEI